MLKKKKIPTKIDADTTDAVAGLNKNDQEPGGINKNSDVTCDQEKKLFFTNTNVTDVDTDSGMGLYEYFILKQVIFITVTLYYP